LEGQGSVNALHRDTQPFWKGGAWWTINRASGRCTTLMWTRGVDPLVIPHGLTTASGAVTASHYFPTTQDISYETIDFARLRLDLPRIAHYSVPSQMGETRSHARGV
jgi:hypothetical protein